MIDFDALLLVKDWQVNLYFFVLAYQTWLIWVVIPFALLFGRVAQGIVRAYIGDKSPLPKKIRRLSMLPIVGAVFVCRYAHLESISKKNTRQTKQMKYKCLVDRYVVFEVIHLLIWLFAYSVIGIHGWLPFAFVAISIYLIIAYVDARKMIIPNKITAILFIIAILFFITPYSLPHYGLVVTRVDRIIGFLIALFLLMIIWIVKKTKNVDAFGLGDIKMIAATGLLLGWHLTFFGIGFAAILGALWLLIHKVVLKKPPLKELPFGPFLSTAFMISMIIGLDFVVWYLDLFT